MTAPMRRLVVRTVAAAAVGTFGTVMVALGTSAAAEGEGVVRNYLATVTVNSNGTIDVSEVMDYDDGGDAEGGAATHQVERTLITREHYDSDEDRVYDVNDVRVEVDGANAAATVDSSQSQVELAVEIPSGTARVHWEYTITGAVAQTADGIEVRWPVVQGFDRELEGARVDWNAPNVLWLSCLTGAPGSARPCTTSQLADGPGPSMTQQTVPAGNQMVGILGLAADSGVSPNADYTTRWSLAHSFDSTGAELAIALILLFLALLASFLLWWTRGRDVSGGANQFESPIRLADDGSWVFTPPSAIRPGQLGTLIDERADVIDVAATIVDLGARNYLFIEEIDRGAFGRMDWRLRRRNRAGEELLGYERTVFDALFADADELLVSAMPEVLPDRLGRVQAQMYADMVDQGWFAERPDTVRGRWTHRRLGGRCLWPRTDHRARVGEHVRPCRLGGCSRWSLPRRSGSDCSGSDGSGKSASEPTPGAPRMAGDRSHRRAATRPT